MPTYVTLINWTEEGVRSFRESPQRANAVNAAAERVGARMVDLYWTVGQYDLVAVAEAPDEETISALMLGVAAQGNVRTTTMRAFSADEFQQVIDKVGPPA
jgi:uncharacterized protein with GYD domain